MSLALNFEIQQSDRINLHGRTVHLDIIKVFTPTDAQVLIFCR